MVESTADDAVRFYPWTIDNKYYSADINLCVVPNKFLVTAEIAKTVQAFVVYFDSTQVRFDFACHLCIFFVNSLKNISFSVVCAFSFSLEIWS